MFKNGKVLLLSFMMFALMSGVSYAYNTQYVFIVTLDGLRYTETFDSPALIPHIWNDLRPQGVINTSVYNSYQTETKYGISSISNGTWATYTTRTPVYTNEPSHWEYLRKKYGYSQRLTYYVVPYVASPTWYNYSKASDYGRNYWPTSTISQSSLTDDTAVWAKCMEVMDAYHPVLLQLYLYNAESSAHLGDWNGYTGNIINEDSIVYSLWNKIQSDPVYAGKTTLFVTNDHGRHTADFSGHGDLCEGCKHVMFLAIGPDFRAGYSSAVSRTIKDITPTALDLLGLTPSEYPYVTGSVMTELFPPATPTLHVQSINMTVQTDGINTYSAAKTTVVDGSLLPVDGALVEGHWEGLTADADNGYTDINGEYSTSSDNTSGVYGVYTWVVDNVVKAGYDYHPSENFESRDSLSTKIHIETITMNKSVSGDNTSGVAVNYITDELGNPVESVTVEGTWTGLSSDADAGQTDYTGNYQAESDQVYQAAGTFTWTVGNVVKSGYYYDSSANVETTDSITVSAVPVMHVESIAMSSGVTGKNYYGIAETIVFDGDGNPLADATVSGHWSGAASDSDSGLTGEAGEFSCLSNSKKNGGTFTWTIDSVSKTGCTYDAGQNKETSDSVTAP